MTLARDVHVRASRSDRPSAAVVALVRPAMAPCRARATGGGDPGGSHLAASPHPEASRPKPPPRPHRLAVPAAIGP